MNIDENQKKTDFNAKSLTSIPFGVIIGSLNGGYQWRARKCLAKLPTAALSPGQRGLWSVYVVVGREGYETIESRPVEVLHTEGERVLVRGTIQSKDRVVSGGVQRIVPGQRVKVQ